MYIETCSLGCGSGQGGTQVSCQFNQAAVNQEIAVFFSEPVDEASITSASFEIIDVSSGASPNGTRFRDPHNPRKVLFRPAISFEDDGSINFGFSQDATYRVLLPGSGQGDTGPFIRSESGGSNQSRLSCDIRTSQQAVDLVPGPPSVTILVKTAVTTTTDPSDFVADVPITSFPIVTDVWQGSDIQFLFDDLMNPATLANPQTGQSAFVRVEVDLDGILSTPDRVELFGTYVVELDPIQLRTKMTFTPQGGIPSAGSLDPLINPDGLPRQLVITVPNNLQDVAGNALANPITASAIPEFVPIDPVILPDADGEDFTDTLNQDVSHSAAGRSDLVVWGDGRLTRGQGGGRGRLGDLVIRSGGTVVLNTDSQTFPLDTAGVHDVLTNAIPGVDYNPLSIATWPTITVTNGAFEFSSLTIESGGTLRIVGNQAARVFVRGNANILGTVDLTGSTPAPKNSQDTLGGVGGAGGPAAGDGADGATRFDYGGSNMIAVGAVDVPNAQVFVDGRRGQGVGGVDFIAAGFGGKHWPAETPLTQNIAPPNNRDLTFSDISDACLSAQTGRPGGGGGYATDGLPGVPMTLVPNSTDGIPNLPPTGPPELVGGGGGPSSDVGLEAPTAPPVIRRLTFEQGYLRGGSGGGGGGATAFGTESNGFSGSCLDANSMVATWRDHSGAGGGGGGGALQLVCGGAALSISGKIDVGGGDGGSGLEAVPSDDEEAEFRTKRAVPGGGGSGGAIRIQAVNFPSSALSSAMPPRLDISGGAGGRNTLGTIGGQGGAGLIRLEGLNSLPVAADIASLIAPTDTAVVGADALNVLSIGSWNIPRLRPESYSGSMSCWMRPEGNFFQIVFLDDSPSEKNPDERYGWDMDVLYGSPAQAYSYRDPSNSPFSPQSIEQRFGNVFDGPSPGSYVVVRFQGARSAGEITDLCNVDPLTQIVTGSQTPWVSHPAQLNQFSPRPNMIRFCVIFDFAATFGNPQSQVQGVTALRIRTQPD